MTLNAIEPTKKGVNDQALCGVPLSKNAGRCQKPQIAPRINPDQMGANFRCNRGRARPRQPNSSIGPLIAVNANATISDSTEEKGNGSAKRFPFNAEPLKKISGMPIVKKT